MPEHSNKTTLLHSDYIDENRLRIKNSMEWYTITPVNTETIISSYTSETIDMNDHICENCHLFIDCTPIGLTDLTITLEKSHDGTLWIPDSNTYSITKDQDYHLLDPVPKYFRIKVDNNDISDNEVTIHVGYSA